MSESRASSARPRVCDKIERTVALIKPEAVKHADRIQDIILENGFDILLKKEVRLTPEQVQELYDEHKDQSYFQHLIDHLSNNLMIAMCLSKVNAISEWNQLMGPSNVLEARVYWPSSIRAVYGMCDYDEYINSEYINGVHGSQDYNTSLKELNILFPELFEEENRDLHINEYLQATINPTLTEGLNELCKEKPNDPIVWLADWLLTHNPNNLDFPENDDFNLDLQRYGLSPESIKI